MKTTRLEELQGLLASTGYRHILDLGIIGFLTLAFAF
jgi:hypothetical protein